MKPDERQGHEPGNVASAVIADDHAIVRAGLRQVLAKLDIAVVGEACNGYEAIATVRASAPDLVLLDISMPLAQGTEVVQEIQRWSPATRIVIYTGITNAGTLAPLIDCGVDGLFLKYSGIEELEKELPLILQGARYIADEALEVLSAPSPLSDLTGREVQVMFMLIAGKSNRQIADELGISAKTVDKHRSNLMAKLKLHSFADLMQYAVKHELIGSEVSEV